MTAQQILFLLVMSSVGWVIAYRHLRRMPADTVTNYVAWARMKLWVTITPVIPLFLALMLWGAVIKEGL